MSIFEYEVIFMKITISEEAREQLTAEGAKDLKIMLRGYGWAGPVFGLAQAEPAEGDNVVSQDGFNVAVEENLADMINSFQIDYRKGLLRKGFVVFADGSSGDC